MTEMVKERVLNSANVRRTIMELLRAQPGRFRLWKLNRRSRKILDVMAADFRSRSLATAGAYLVNAMLNRMYHQGIHIRDKEIREVYRAALEAQKQGISMVFLPCHRSHVDYIVLSYVFFKLGIGLPFIAAGDNLNLPIVGSMLKYGGAFFIRRKFDKDPLYTVLFKEYIECLLETGFNMEVFIEGTRSRTGKLLTPKFGILKVLLEVLINGRVSDIYLVPISIGYDKVIETSSYVNELMGAPKETESLSGIFASTRVLQLKLGRIDIRFSSPFSLKNYITEQIESRVNFSPHDKEGDFLLLLRSLGYRVCSDINEVAVIMPTALVGTILLSLRGRGISRDEVSCFWPPPIVISPVRLTILLLHSILLVDKKGRLAQK
jgi:glycerol-3-phosphate O-acyltransferase